MENKLQVASLEFPSKYVDAPHLILPTLVGLTHPEAVKPLDLDAMILDQIGSLAHPKATRLLNLNPRFLDQMRSLMQFGAA